MGHTPGPWVVGGASGNEGEAREIVAASRTIAWSASTWDEDEGDVVTEEDDANAHLIAAAPDLLAALRDCRDWLVAICDSNNLEATERIYIEAATAAIEKAEGRRA